jgi:hypothetical protein
MRLVVEDWRECYLESEPEAPASLSQISELKRLPIRLGLSAEVRLTSISQTHFNIANNVHQVFFFVFTFVEMVCLRDLKAPANTCVR